MTSLKEMSTLKFVKCPLILSMLIKKTVICFETILIAI